MRKIKMKTLFLATLLVATPISAVYAGNGNAVGNGLPNGKPFQTLNSLIETNQALIEANQADIADLQATTDGLRADVDALFVDVGTLKDRVAVNEAELDQAFASMNGLWEDVASLASDLQLLQTRHEADIAEMKIQIDTMKSSLATLNDQMLALADTLSQKAAELRNAIDENATGLWKLLADVVLLTAEVSNMNVAVTDQENNISSLNDQVVGHTAKLLELGNRLQALKTATDNASSGSSGSQISFTKRYGWVRGQGPTHQFAYVSYNTCESKCRQRSYDQCAFFIYYKPVYGWGDYSYRGCALYTSYARNTGRHESYGPWNTYYRNK